MDDVYSPRSVIITGGHGFAGQYLLRELQQAWLSTDLFVWDREERPSAEGVTSVVVDLTEPLSYRSHLWQPKPDWIVHLAAFTAVGKSWLAEEEVAVTNTEATRWLLQAVEEESPGTKVFIASTADIYGALAVKFGAKPMPERPLYQAEPGNPYARSKLKMEAMIEALFNDRCLRVRPFPHIGPGQKTGFVTADFASQIAAIEAGKQEPIIKVGNLSAERDFTDVRDVVRAYRLLMEAEKMGEVYHVASGRVVTIQSILDQLLSEARVPIKVETDPEFLRPSDTPIVMGDASKLKADTGWEPVIPLEQSLKDILSWWRQQHDAK